MKITKILTILTAMALLSVPALSMAATYQYVDTSGNLQTVEANSSTEALNTAFNIGAHSGVMLVGDRDFRTSFTTTRTVTVNTTGDNYYQYVDTNGNLQGLWASSATEALNTAQQIGIHSGVMLTNK